MDLQGELVSQSRAFFRVRIGRSSNFKKGAMEKWVLLCTAEVPGTSVLEH